MKSTLISVALACAGALSTQAASLREYLYRDVPGTTLVYLTDYQTNSSGIVVYPDLAETNRFPVGNTGPFEAEYADNAAGFENFGRRLLGYLEPPETGNYTFWLYGDDETRLWITTDPADPLNPAKMQPIAWVSGYTAARQWNKFAEQQSAPVYLEKGKQYYLETLQKEGTGGDSMGLGWQLPSGKLERPMQVFYFQPIPDPAITTVVDGPTAGPIMQMSPGDFSIYDGMEVMLFADLNLTPPYTVQWLRGTTEIPGANQTYYRFRARVSTDHGAEFWVRVNGTLYGPYILNVYADNTAPSLESAGLTPNNPTQIQLVFSEAVTPVSATNANYYTLNNSGTVYSAQLQDDLRTVLLKTSLLMPGKLHTLTINNIQDNAGNTIAANTQTNLLVMDGAVSFRSWGYSRPDSLATLRTWSHAGSTALSYVDNKFIEERVITTTSYQWNLVPERQNFTAQMIGYLTPPETGFYKFVVASDDHSILYLGTSDQRSSKREICYSDGSTGRWNTGQRPNQQSVLIYLEAGKPYYFEAVYRDGTGGDGVSVFWQTPSGPQIPIINQSVQSSTERFLIPAQYLSTYASPPVPGAISYRIWDTLPTDLTGTGTGIYFNLRTWSATNSTAPSYTNNMFVDERIITTNSYPWNLVPLDDHYMGQIIGYLTAPETGNYQFAITSDDHSVLYLGTSDQRSSKREICSNNAYTTARWNLGANAAQRSANIALVAGQRYYIEAVYRDGTGNDGVTIAWYTPSMLAEGWAWPPSPANTESATVPYIIPATYMSTFNTFGNVFLKTDLAASFSAAESTQPTLSVLADGSRPYTYQWYRGSEPIAGATAASYKLPYVRPADSGVAFSVVVSNNFSSVTSVAAVLTATADTTKPTVASVGSLFKQTVEVRLSEPVTPASAAAVENYLLLNSAGSPVAVSSAVQDAQDGAHITLQTAALPETDLMKLVVQNLVDLSAAANAMDPQTNTFQANNFDALTRINNSQAFGATAAGSQLTMTAGGSDIWGNSDQLVFLRKTLTGNFDYKVQGFSLPTVNQWCKMGIMARASTNANARNAFVAFTPLTPAQNTYTPQIRDLTGQASTSSDVAGTILNAGLQPGVVARPTVAYPSWLRLQRIGDVFHYYYSTTGTNWVWWTYYDSAASAEGAMPSTLEVGLALTSHDTARTVDGVMTSFTAMNDGALFLALQPTNTTVVEGGTAVFYAAAGGNSPWFYQWRKNNTDIPDATNAVLSLPRVSFCADNNALIACRISNGYGETLTSPNVTLTVIQDTTLPTVAFYATPKISLNINEARLLFSEWVDAASSQDVNNYRIYTSPGNVELAVTGAVLGSDERTIVLSTAAQTPGATYRVVVSNVKDLACNPNTIVANSTDYFFCSGTAANFLQRADGFIFMEAESAQRLTQSTVLTTPQDWQLQNLTAGYSGPFSGVGFMNITNVRAAGGSGGTTPITGGLSQGTGPMMEYDVKFTRAATNYTLWIRGAQAPDGDPAGNNDSIYVGIDGNLISVGGSANNVEYSQFTGWSGTLGTWGWVSISSGGPDPVVLTNVTPGIHTIVIWGREDGTALDKICIEPGVRSGTTAPTQATGNSGLGEAETWDFLAAPPGGPTVTITSPTAGQFSAGDVVITATVSGPAPAARVEFFQGTNLIGTATSAPYTITWANVPEGIYSLTARATDVLGYQTTSAAVQIVEAGALALTDVTTPGDPIYLTAGSSPAAETVTNMINNTTSKCLNYDAFDSGLPFVGPVGFVVTPSAGRSIVSKLRFYTANDAEARDPVNYVFEGSDDNVTWSLISSNLLTLPVGRNAATLALNPMTQNVWHVAFGNTTAYNSYRLQFFNVKSESAANSMQLAEVELLGTIVQPPTLSITSGTGGGLVLSVSKPGTLLSTTNLTAPVIWVEEGPISGTVIITPAVEVPDKYYRLRVP